jgi:hypothetical protein
MNYERFRISRVKQKATQSSRKQKAESRKQKAESRKQKAESRKQSSRKQKAESRKQKAACFYQHSVPNGTENATIERPCRDVKKIMWDRNT